MYENVHRGEPEARLLVLGDGPLTDVELQETGQHFQLGEERQRQAEQDCERLRQGGQTITADPVYRLQSWTVGPTFTLQVDRGDYSQVVGTKSHPEWGIKAQVLAVCCVLECPQGFVIEQRSQRVAALPGQWHIAPSGSLQPPTTPYQTLLQEASEELGLEATEVLEIRCLGLLYGERSGVYQMACSARTQVSLQDMLARERSGAWEQDGLLCAPACPQQLPIWLQQHDHHVTRGARAVLWAEGLRRWGRPWFEEQCEDQP